VSLENHGLILASYSHLSMWRGLRSSRLQSASRTDQDFSQGSTSGGVIDPRKGVGWGVAGESKPCQSQSAENQSHNHDVLLASLRNRLTLQLTVLKSDMLRIQANPPLRGLVRHQDRMRCGSASIPAKTLDFDDLSDLEV
jgi:hypothetical protein